MAEILVAGQSGMALDLYVKAGSTLYSPNPYPTFTVYDTNNAFQGSGTGFLLSVGHFDARNFTIPSSGAQGQWHIIWSVVGATQTNYFTVTSPTLTDVGDIQNIIDRIKEHIRFDMGDWQKDIFADFQLESYIDKSVRRLNRELGISRTVRPTGITPGGIGTPAITPYIRVDFLQGTLFPPTDEIEDIVVLQAEVLITRAEMATLRRSSAIGAAAEGSILIHAGSGITSDIGAGLRIRNADGVEVDTTARLTSWITNKTRLFLDEAHAREDELKRAILKLRGDIAANSTKVIF